MNIYAIIILTTLLVSYFLHLIAELLNLKALRQGLPEEFADVFDEEKYQKSQAYTRSQTRFGLVVDTFNLALVLVFWFAGGFQYLDEFVRGFQWGPITRGLVYIGILIFARKIIFLPFSIYDTFVLEEKFGFNKTTVKTFIGDFFKESLLTVILGGLLLGGILAFFEYTGVYAWVYAWIATTVFTFVVLYIAPTFIMPLFYKFSPLEDEELKEKITQYSESVGFPLQGIYVIDGSRRSTKSNAFFTGFGKNKRIALFDTLINKQTHDELLAVLAHEVGHYKKKHILQGLLISIAHTGITFFLLSLFLHHEGLFEAFYVQKQSVYAGLIFFGMLYKPISLILSIFMQMFSRKNEYEADRFAVETVQENPQAMVSALKKLSRDNLSNLTPHPFYVFLFYSHPPVLQRIQAIRHKLAQG